MIIVERLFTADDAEIRLEVHKPVADPRGDFRCDFTFRGAGLDKTSYAAGVDPMQALILALQRAHVELLAARRDTGLPIGWLGSRDLGLPLMSNVTPADFDAPLD